MSYYKGQATPELFNWELLSGAVDSVILLNDFLSLISNKMQFIGLWVCVNRVPTPK